MHSSHSGQDLERRRLAIVRALKGQFAETARDSSREDSDRLRRLEDEVAEVRRHLSELAETVPHRVGSAPDWDDDCPADVPEVPEVTPVRMSARASQALFGY